VTLVPFAIIPRHTQRITRRQGGGDEAYINIRWGSRPRPTPGQTMPTKLAKDRERIPLEERILN